MNELRANLELSRNVSERLDVRFWLELLIILTSCTCVATAGLYTDMLDYGNNNRTSIH